MQSLTCEKQHRMGVFKMLTTMMKEEGVFRPIRGVNAMAAGAGPAHALYFSCLESGKDLAERTPFIPPSLADGQCPGAVFQ
jgi:solute carrier family 25 iron transporter 28/37